MPAMPLDKTLHFLVCFLFTILLFPLLSWWSIGTAIATGFMKEIYDWRDYGGFSWADIIADLAGVIIATTILILIRI